MLSGRLAVGIDIRSGNELSSVVIPVTIAAGEKTPKPCMPVKLGSFAQIPKVPGVAGEVIPSNTL